MMISCIMSWVGHIVALEGRKNKSPIGVIGVNVSFACRPRGGNVYVSRSLL